MKNFTLILLTILISCSQDDNFIEETLNTECKVVGTNGVRVINQGGLIDYYDSQTTIDSHTQIVYPVQYIYDLTNKLIRRIRYDKPSVIGTDFKDIDSLIYDSNNRLIEISTYDRVRNYTAIKFFEYNNSSDTKPSKMTRYRQEINSSRYLTYTELLTYNDEGKLEKTERNHNSNDSTYKENFKYDFDGNLIEIEKIYFDSEINSTIITLETFGNYDNYRNPYKNLPFLDIRGKSESNNNYLSYTKKSTLYSESNPNGEIFEISEYSYEPTDLSYLETSKYQCD